MEKAWLNLYEASVYTGLSESRLRRAYKKRECRATKKPGRWLAHVDDLDAWLKSGIPVQREDPDQMPRTPRSEAAALRALVREP
jgi:hypothetical protein